MPLRNEAHFPQEASFRVITLERDARHLNGRYESLDELRKACNGASYLLRYDPEIKEYFLVRKTSDKHSTSYKGMAVVSPEHPARSMHS